MSSRSARVRFVCLVAVFWVAAAVVVAQDAPAPETAQEFASNDPQQVPPEGDLPVPSAPTPPATPPTTAPPSEPYVEPQAAPESPAATASEAAGERTDTGAEGESDEDEAEEEKLAWRGTSLAWDHTITKDTLDKGAELYYNPTYVQSLGVRLRWYFSDTLSLRLGQNMAVELTDSDSDTEKQQLLFDDTRLDLVESKLYEWQEIVLRVGGTLRLPLSLNSQAERRIVGIGPTVGLSRDFDVLEGLNLDASGAYRHIFGLSNMPHVDRPYPCKTIEECDQVPGLPNVRDSFLTGLDASLAFLEELSFGLGVAGAWSLADDLAPAPIVGPDMSKTHWRNSFDFHAALSYGPWKWLGIDLGLATITSHQRLFPAAGADGRNPIWNPNTTLSLTFTLGIDELYLEASGREGAGNAPSNVTNQEASRAAPLGT